MVIALAPPDRWFGVDKVKHFVASAFAQSAAYSALQYAGVGHRPAVAGSLAFGGAAGIARELHDRRRKGQFSYRDLAWDAAGLAAATALVSHARR